MFALKLAVEPAGKIAQRFEHGVLGIGGHVLPGGALSLDRDYQTRPGRPLTLNVVIGSVAPETWTRDGRPGHGHAKAA